MNWKERAMKSLRDSLYPVPEELNELDWKTALSEKSERLAQHISAFSNYKGGGVLVYGVRNCLNLKKVDTCKHKICSVVVCEPGMRKQRYVFYRTADVCQTTTAAATM